MHSILSFEQVESISPVRVYSLIPSFHDRKIASEHRGIENTLSGRAMGPNVDTMSTHIMT